MKQKHFIALILTLSLASYALTGCSSGTETAPAETAQTASTEAAENVA